MRMSALAYLIRSRLILSSLIISGGSFVSPAVNSTLYLNTIDLASQQINPGDVINTGDANGIISGANDNTGLQLGDAKVSLIVNTQGSMQPVSGINLSASAAPAHALGKNSSIEVTAKDSAQATYGVLAGDGLSIRSSDLTMNISGHDHAWAIYAGNGVVSLEDNTSIFTHSDKHATAIGLSGNLHTGRLQLITQGASATGIMTAQGKDRSLLNLGEGSEYIVNTRDTLGTSAAIETNGPTTIIANNLKITTTDAHGIKVNKGAADISLGSGSSININGETGYSGLYLSGDDGGSSVDAENLTVSTTGKNGYGLNLNVGTGNVALRGKTSISTSGDGAHAIWLSGPYNKASQLTAENLLIHTSGKNAVAMELTTGVTNVAAGEFKAENGAGIIAARTSGNTAPVVTINNSSVRAKGLAASAQQAGTVLNLHKVQAAAQGAYGIWAVTGGEVNMTDSSLSVAPSTYALVANNGGQINFSGATSISGSEIAMATDSPASWIKGSGHMMVDGGLYARNNAAIALDMADGSVLNGLASRTNGGVVNLSLRNSLWNMSDSSDVSELALDNGTVNFGGTEKFKTLRATSLSGRGNFTMRTDLAALKGDVIAVSGTTRGEHQLTVTNNGSAETDGKEVLTLVETADGGGKFSLKNDVELGGYVYSLRQQEKNWQLVSLAQARPEPPPVPVPQPQPPISSAASASANTLNIGYLLKFADMSTLMQRMGQIRREEKDENVWLHGYGGNFRAFDNGKLNGFLMNYRGYQLGADKQWPQANSLTYMGFAAGSTVSDQTYLNGSGNVKNYNVGLYAGYLHDSGFYLDAAFKYNRMRTAISVLDTQGNEVSGKAASNGLSLSLESGKRFYFSGENAGPYIEPQLQTLVFRQESSRFHNTNGLTVDLSGYTSATGRAGGLLGYSAREGETPINFYFKSNYLHEFKGKASYRLNGNKEGHSFRGDFWSNGVGVSAGIARQHELYFDMERVNGKRFTQNKVNAGYRFSF
ncbi:autotransporter outer membrane beta-barrel domain-containing protein [Cedecea colo]|nr:autotransporter outer membrane beta-barrel domain-containing protein [Cedecea colo]